MSGDMDYIAVGIILVAVVVALRWLIVHGRAGEVSGEYLDVLAILNAWADADLDRVRATHAKLAAQVLPRPPLVLPRRYGEGQRAMRRRTEPRS